MTLGSRSAIADMTRIPVYVYHAAEANVPDPWTVAGHADLIYTQMADGLGADYAKMLSLFHRLTGIYVWDDARADKPKDLTPVHPELYDPAKRTVTILASWYNSGTLAHGIGHHWHMTLNIGPNADAFGKRVWALAQALFKWRSFEDAAEDFVTAYGMQGRVLPSGLRELFQMPVFGRL